MATDHESHEGECNRTAWKNSLSCPYGNPDTSLPAFGERAFLQAVGGENYPEKHNEYKQALPQSGEAVRYEYRYVGLELASGPRRGKQSFADRQVIDLTSGCRS